MASPFPGMDPYLEGEALWPEFHHQFVTCLYQILLPGLVERYRARVGQRAYVTEQALFTSIIREERQEEFIEIRQRGESRLVTLVEVVSPANKTAPSGRQAYLAKRREGRMSGANLVEIDLVLQGAPMLDYAREGLPEWDYAITVTRATAPERYEFYPATLQKRLPRFKLPLGGDDKDIQVDLQAAFTRCYEQGGFAAKVDYLKDPSAPLDEGDQEWSDQLLKQQKLR